MHRYKLWVRVGSQTYDLGFCEEESEIAAETTCKVRWLYAAEWFEHSPKADWYGVEWMDEEPSYVSL